MATKKSAKKTTKKKSPTAPKSKPTTKSAAKKTTKKSAAKTSIKSTTTISKTTPAKATVEKQPTTPQTTVYMRRPYVIIVVAVLVLGALLYYFRGLFVAAVVNGQPISRLAVVQQAEKQSGKQTLDTLVRDALIEQKAKEENVTVTDKEINDEITTLQNNLKKQGQTLDQVLAAQGMSQDDLRRLIRLDKLVQKMVGKDVKVTDQEVNDYINKNKNSLPSTDEVTLKKQVKAQLTQQKTNEAVQAWLANLQQQAHIVYFVQY